MFEDDHTCELSFDDVHVIGDFHEEPTRELARDRVSERQRAQRASVTHGDVTLELPPIARPLSVPSVVLDLTMAPARTPSTDRSRSARAACLTWWSGLMTTAREPLALAFAAMFVIASVLAGGFGIMVGAMAPAQRTTAAAAAAAPALAELRVPRVVVVTSAREEITLAPPMATVKVRSPEPRVTAPAPLPARRPFPPAPAPAPAQPRGFGHLGASR